MNDLDLKPGMYVALNQRTFAIMDILSIIEEELMKARKKVFLGVRIPENEPRFNFLLMIYFSINSQEKNEKSLEN